VPSPDTESTDATDHEAHGAPEPRPPPRHPWPPWPHPCRALRGRIRVVRRALSLTTSPRAT